MLMIPDNWLKKPVTVDEVEALTHLDLLKGVIPFEFVPEDIVDKSKWFNEYAVRDLPAWQKFKKDLQTGDELWYWAAPQFNNMKGYAIKRDGKIFNAVQV